MKRQLLTLVFTALGAFSTFAQFNAGNLAVYRYGNGAAPLTNGVRVPVFVDEYTPAGLFVKTVAIPQTASGNNYGFEGLGLTAGGAFEAEGYPVLSKDGSTLSMIGRLNAGANNEFVIATVNAAGTLTANTKIAAIDNIGSPRSAVVEGAAVYFNGYQNGIRYKALGNDDASIRVSSGQDAPRVLTIAETAYGATPTIATKIFAPIGSTTIPSANLPTSSVSFTALPNIPGGASLVNAHQVLAFKSASGRTLIYVLDDNGGAPLIKKYRSNMGGTDWVEFGNISVPLNTKSIGGVYSRSTGVKLYFTTYANQSAGNASQLYTISNSFTTLAEGDAAARLTGSATLIATAPANTTFRGVTMAPGTSVLPVTLTSFNANEKNGVIRLNWRTESETRNAHFEILRSSTGRDFVKIEQVGGKGTISTASNYSFLDEKPLPGVNYYKLRQVDLNGSSEEFGPVSATVALPKTDFVIIKNAVDLELNIYAVKAQHAKIEVIDLNGKVNHKQSASLGRGYNSVALPAGKLPKGLNLIVLKTVEGKVTKKAML